jgi:hypothetical protein
MYIDWAFYKLYSFWLHFMGVLLGGSMQGVTLLNACMYNLFAQFYLSRVVR